MAVMTSPYLSDIASPEQKQPSKMASLADELAPTSNGVNGHSLPEAKEPAPVTSSETASKPSEPVTGASDPTANSTLNAEAFSSNDLAVQPPSNTEAAVSEKAESAHADSEVKTESAPAKEHPDGSTESAEPSASKPADESPKEPTGAEPNEKPAEEPAGKPAEEPTAVSEEKESPGNEKEETASAKEETSSRKEVSAEEDKPQSEGTPAEPPKDSSEPASEAPLTAEAPKATPAEEAKPAEPEISDVEMSGAASVDKPATAESAAPEKTEDTVMTEAPSATAHSHSSLLPSLRDDGSREHSSVSAAADTVMADAPSNKIAREREDDHEEERSAKRAKTEDAETSAPTTGDSIEAAAVASTDALVEVPPVVLPPRVRAIAKPGSLADPELDSLPISTYANREIRRVLASVKKTKVGNNFKDPVFKKWPGLWETYTLRVSKPMDISQMERNLRENVYTTHAAFIDDIFLIHENSLAFNGVGNTVTDEAKALVDNFFTRLSDISSKEPQKPEKKESKQLPTRQTEPRAAASRRESKGAATSPIEDSVTAASPLAVSTSAAVAAAATPAPAAPTPVEVTTPVFAVPAGGVPIIRRDSAKNDGDRPKRPIHPPKNRDLGYEPKNPKKKQPEFRFCEEVLKELMKLKHYDTNHWFLRPVDPVAMQIPTYHKVIKKPMDLGTMNSKLSMGEYNSAKEFEHDVNLIIKNCRKFNIIGDVVDAANRLEDLFKQKWVEKDSWIAAHTAPPAVPSPVAAKEEGSDEEGDDSEAEGDEAAEPVMSSDTVDALVKRLQEENTRLANLLSEKIPNMTDITTQQTVVNILQKQIVEEKTKLAAAESDKRTKKPTKAKAAKGKKAVGGAGTAKKAAGGTGGGNKKQVISAKKAPKARVLGQAEKTVVTDGINNLDGPQLEKAVEIIMKDTHQEESESGELELDIDQLTQDALGKLYDLIVKAFPHMRVKPEKSAKSHIGGDNAGVGKPSKPKKHKPMGKAEQERNIEKLREIKAQFQRPGSGSQEPLPSVEVNQPAQEEEESEEESDADSEEE